MKNAILIGAIAVAIGVAGAAAVFHFVKPQDRPLQLGSAPQPVTDPMPNALPRFLVLGERNSNTIIHLVMGDDFEADKRAYRDVTDAMIGSYYALNIIPATTNNQGLLSGIAWTIAAEPDSPAFFTGLMGTSGDITPQVLHLIAQNNGLDAAKLQTRAESVQMQKVLDHAKSVIPPQTPAVLVGGTWLYGSDITSTRIAELAGVNTATTAAAEGEDTITTRLLIKDAYAFATPPQPKTGAVFMTLENAGDASVKIIGASTSVAARVEIHDMTMENDVMKMRKMDTLDIPAGEQAVLKPSGKHVMLFDLPAPLVVGQTFPLTLQMESGVEIGAQVKVVAPGDASLTPAPHSH